MLVFVVSNIESKRTTYFIQAGRESGIQARFITYDELIKNLSGYDDAVIKLEPPSYKESDFLAYNNLCIDYIRLLEHISSIKKAENVHFINDPLSLCSTLDKVVNKSLLSGLPVTPVLSSSVHHYDELIELLNRQKKNNVFIKPRYGSGAGGIIALKQNSRTKELIAYTTLKKNGDRFYNTKRINRLTHNKDIADYTNAVFNSEALVEEWIVKDMFEGMNYDLRVVGQFGNIEHIVIRYSKGTITNLHLNNKVGNFSDLKVSDDLLKKIRQISVQSIEMSGLNYGGVDVLIKKDSGEPYIIEVNGQGDHIYQDIFNENRIYKNQIKHYVS